IFFFTVLYSLARHACLCTTGRFDLSKPAGRINRRARTWNPPNTGESCRSLSQELATVKQKNIKSHSRCFSPAWKTGNATRDFSSVSRPCTRELQRGAILIKNYGSFSGIVGPGNVLKAFNHCVASRIVRHGEPACG